MSVSASRYSSSVRGDFDRLLADLDAGRYGARVMLTRPERTTWFRLLVVK
ncbi:MAG TPA: hypothetical protein VMV92_31195 [Streptosporangiaceae bacterium]|nr:hypothetical protein [Streptosporangiaceae bacterium]HVB41435.1 hypothetical protein [Streptosporangiaceae bacterium]